MLIDLLVIYLCFLAPLLSLPFPDAPLLVNPAEQPAIMTLTLLTGTQLIHSSAFHPLSSSTSRGHIFSVSRDSGSMAPFPPDAIIHLSRTSFTAFPFFCVPGCSFALYLYLPSALHGAQTGIASKISSPGKGVPTNASSVVIFCA